MSPTKLTLGLLTPVITALAAWLTASVAKYGVHLDNSGVNAALVTGATAGISVMIKLIHDVETDVKPELSAADDNRLQKLLQDAGPQIRKEVSYEIETQIFKLAHRIEPSSQGAHEQAVTALASEPPLAEIAPEPEPERDAEPEPERDAEPEPERDAEPQPERDAALEPELVPDPDVVLEHVPALAATPHAESTATVAPPGPDAPAPGPEHRPRVPALG